MLRTFGAPAVLTVAALGAGLLLGGPTTAAIVLLLGVLEVSLSFDNAVVNARVLATMSPVWQKLFLTVGIVIAVFGVRLVLPVLVVAATAHLSIPDVTRLAVNDPTAYGNALADARHAIYAFGGTFLLMLFLDFMLDPERDVRWLTWLETPLAAIGRLDQLSVVVALGAILGMGQLTGPHDRVTVLVAGLAGLVVYLLVNGVAELFEGRLEGASDPPAAAGGVTRVRDMTRPVFTAGIATFVYLEVLDASFSFDGVIGAFALSDEVAVIALGLGIGALWIRSLTLYLVRQGTLSEYIYLEHGAHWAIGALAVIMLLEVRYEVPEVVTGLVGVAFIALAMGSSLLERRRRPRALPGGRTDPAADAAHVGAHFG
ncbi:MAG: hypothetical protein JWM48_976 [Mycobacterium sp.]|nr:hypothetical protein [Mycobacterium sp.]